MISIRRSFELEGRLQGVGFRPLVYRLAKSYDLTGFIRNTGQGVWLELQGPVTQVENFEGQLKRDLPPAASIRRVRKSELPLCDEKSFEIKLSSSVENFKKTNSSSAEILPDLATCLPCSLEIADPSNRRYRYPFTHCTDCGPRYSILKNLPFDRANTTMAEFKMCKACHGEYCDPNNRRFHAQTICCADCGPSYILKNAVGELISENDSALRQAAEKIRRGFVVAVLGVGGFHLFCDARQKEVVKKLRQKKKRDSKPFALMVPTLEWARQLCEISLLEEQMLLGQGAPIVLLKSTRESETLVSPEVAPGIGTLGLMLPYSPLHKLLMEELGHPVIATSGNISEEPICFQEKDAISRLGGIADFFLIHNRPIASRVDDSVVREIAGTEVVFRAGRGYSPLVVESVYKGMSTATEVLALGGHQKNTLAFSQKDRVVLMPHIGNLDSLEAVNDYARSLEQVIDMQQLSRSHKACDYHPDYHSTRVARSQDSVDILQVQHHEAHLLSCVAEHQIKGPVFGVAWDGTGYGADGTIWGGEFFTGSENGFSRWGHLKQFKLPGGAAAIRESRRAALGLLFAIGVQDANWNHSLLGLSQTEVSLLYKLMEQDLNSPYTSSAGRLFDGVSALIGIRNHCDYEGQAAIELEFKASQIEKCETYPIKITFQKSSEIDSKSQNILDWELWIQRILRDLEQGVTKTQIAAQFHKTLACSIVEMAKRAGIKQVVLSGGCFQNKLLSEWTILELRKNDFSPFWNQRVPPNDGGLSVGQVLGGHNVLIRSSSAAINLG